MLTHDNEERRNNIAMHDCRQQLKKTNIFLAFSSLSATAISHAISFLLVVMFSVPMSNILSSGEKFQV